MSLFWFACVLAVLAFAAGDIADNLVFGEDPRAPVEVDGALICHACNAVVLETVKYVRLPRYFPSFSSLARSSGPEKHVQEGLVGECGPGIFGQGVHAAGVEPLCVHSSKDGERMSDIPQRSRRRAARRARTGRHLLATVSAAV